MGSKKHAMDQIAASGAKVESARVLRVGKDMSQVGRERAGPSTAGGAIGDLKLDQARRLRERGWEDARLDGAAHPRRLYSRLRPGSAEQIARTTPRLRPTAKISSLQMPWMYCKLAWGSLLFSLMAIAVAR